VKQHSVHRRTITAALAAAAALLLTSCASSPATQHSSSSGKDVVIAFSQAFSSNSWQAENDKAAQAAIDKLKSAGKVKKYIFADANNSVTTQISQINSMILQKPDVIMVDPSSNTGLNGVIQKSVNAGIPVLVFTDGPVTSTLPYDLEAPLSDYTETLANFIVKQLGGKGNVLNVRGVAGTGADNIEQSGTDKAFKAAPGIKVVGTVYGSWDEATAQSAVAKALPGLPKIDAVMQQGGSGYGIAQAFAAADRPVPLIVMGNRGEELSWWAQQKDKSGYQSLSINPNPGIGSSAVYVAYAIATGQKVPKKMTMPTLQVTQDTLSQFSSLGTGDVASTSYDQAWTQKNVIATGTN